MKVLPLLAALLLTAQSVLALTWSKNDFAKGYELQFQQHKAIHHLSLSEEVYATVVQPTVADIRVFNGQGQPVPHLLKMETTKTSQVVSEVELPFSPLYNIEQTGTVRYVERQLLPEVEERGAKGFVQTEREEIEETRKVNGVLIETERALVTPFRLHFTFRAHSDFMTTMTMEESDDLTAWRRIGAETLAMLNFQGHLIEKNSEQLIHGKKKYLRVSWPTSQQDLAIERIQAVSVTGETPRVRNWTALASQRIADEKLPHTIVLEFDSQGVFPVDTIRLGFPPHNTLIQVTIKSRSGPEAPWRRQGGGILYRLEADGVILNNDTISVPLTTDRYWRMEIAAAEQDYSAETLPKLELGWTPHELYFLSQGPGPYVLAFGNGRMPPGSINTGIGLASLLEDNEKKSAVIATAEILGRVELGGPDRLLPPPLPIPWKTWLLWSILVSGVVLIGSMAYTLYRQMNGEGRERI